MSRTSTQSTVRSVVDDLDRQLRQRRIGTVKRRELLTDVRADLEEAAAAGQDPRSVVGDVGQFVDDVVEAGGLTPAPREPWLSPGIALLGGVGALVAAYVVIEVVLHPLLTDLVDLPGRYPVVGPVLVFVLLAVATVAGMVGAFAIAVRGRSAARESVRAGLVAIPVGALVGGAAAVAYAVHAGWDTTNPTINTEIVLVVVPCLLGVVAARTLGLRAARRRQE